jgi:hypothetical protein
MADILGGGGAVTSAAINAPPLSSGRGNPKMMSSRFICRAAQ